MASTTNYEPPAPMTDAQKTLIAEEDRYRQIFAENPHSSELNDPHLLLIDVFSNQHAFQYEEETPDEKKIPKLLTQSRVLGRVGSSIVAKDVFERRWKTFTNGVLDGMDWSNVFISGGAVLACLSSDEDGFKSSDIDIFLTGIHSEHEANQKLRHIHQIVTQNTRSRGDVIRTERAITILNSYPNRHVQIILRLYKSPCEVLLGFDIDSCTLGYDGDRVWAMERGKRALNKGYNLVNHSRRSLTYEQRLFKYSKRGFAVAVPNLDKARVDPTIFSNRLRDTTGLAKLLMYDHRASSGSYVPKRSKDTEEEKSDYSELHIPWGPGWFAPRITNKLNSRAKATFFAARKGTTKDGHENAVGTLRDRPQTKPGGSKKAWVFVTSIDEALQGGVSWVTDNPAYQDYDNGYTRKLMTGSFHPVIDENWEKGAYAEPGKPSGYAPPARKKGNQFKLKAKPYKPPRKMATKRPAKKAKKTKKARKTKKAARLPTKTLPKKRLPKALPSASKAVSGGWNWGNAPAAAAPPTSAAWGNTNTAASSAWGNANAAAPATSAAWGNTNTAAPAASNVWGTGLTTLPAAVPAAVPVAQQYQQPASAAAPSTPLPQPQQFGFNSGLRMPLIGESSQQSPSLFGPQPGATPAPLTQPGSQLFELSGSPSRSPVPQLLSQNFQSPQKRFGGAPQASPSKPFGPQPTGAAALVGFSPIPAGRAGTAVPPPSASQSYLPSQGGFAASQPAQPTRSITKMLLLVSLAYKKGAISADEKGKLKDMIISGVDIIFSAMEVFEIDQDLDELIDTFKRICKIA